jgi:hypothetical protein
MKYATSAAAATTPTQRRRVGEFLKPKYSIQADEAT